MPMSLYKVHPKFQTPYIIQIVIGVIVACITGFTPIHIVAETCSAGTIFAFLCSSVASWFCAASIRIIARIPLPRCPHHCTLRFICCAFIFFELSPHTLMLFSGWTILGWLIYFVYGRKHSVLQKQEENPS